MERTREDLTITTRRRGSELQVCVAGCLDARSELLVGCCRAWADDGARDVVIDLAAVSELDGHGVASLLRCRRVLRARAGRLRVVNAPESPVTPYLVLAQRVPA